MRARALVLIVAVGLMALMADVAVGIGEAAAITSGGTTPAEVPVWAADFMAGAVEVSRERAVAQAEAFDVIAALRGTYRGYVADMKAANPDLVLLVYLNGALAQSTQGEAYPEDWYARDAAGNKVRSLGWGNYLMRPDNPGWVADVVERCGAFLADSGYDGCFLDVLGTAPLNPGYVTGLPIDPSTGEVWTKRAWLRATASIAEQTRLAVAPAPVFGNGLANGSAYFSPDAPSATILEGLDGAMAETFVRDPRGPIASYRSESRWKSDVDMLADAGARGSVVLAMTKVWTGGTAAQVSAWRAYALASFLLGYAPGTAFFSFRDDHGLTDPVDVPAVGLGDPTGGYRRVDGVYQRDFTEGRVLVNPGEQAVTVDLGGRFVDEDGGVVTSVTLQPHTARILARA